MIHFLDLGSTETCIVSACTFGRPSGRACCAGWVPRCSSQRASLLRRKGATPECVRSHPPTTGSGEYRMPSPVVGGEARGSWFRVGWPWRRCRMLGILDSLHWPKKLSCGLNKEQASSFFKKKLFCWKVWLLNFKHAHCGFHLSLQSKGGKFTLSKWISGTIVS
jgi:hypothetical protein